MNPRLNLSSVRMALIVIDMQRDFLSPQGYAAQAGVDVARLRATIEPVQALITKARACDLPVIFTREGHRSDLSDCPPVKLSRSIAAGAEIGSVGPLGRLLVRGEWGHDVVDEMQVQLTDIMIDKPGYSAFHQTDLDQILRCLQVDTLIVCGVTTEVCVQTTVRAATDFGYFCVTISDACAATEASMQQPALDMLLVEGGIFGEVIDSDAMIGQMKLQSRVACP
jgi:biuret amidohydrolase